jgi:hypothetical protein
MKVTTLIHYRLNQCSRASYQLTPLAGIRLVSTSLRSKEHDLAPAWAKRRAGTGDNTTAPKQKEKYRESE